MNQTVLFRAGRQATMVWLVNGLALLCAAGSSWAGVYLAQNYGLEPADGGVLHPLFVRLVMGATIASLGLAFLAGMLVYARCYVVQISAETNDTVQVHLLWPGLRLRLNRQDLLQKQAHAGKSEGRIEVDAPWLALHVRGRRLPLVVDDQGEWLPGVPYWLNPAAHYQQPARQAKRQRRR